jgi:penicillin-binding protein 1A
MTPIFGIEVTDREGNVIEQARPESHDALRADTAYIMTNMLQGVILRGTATRAASLDWPLGGKTGTTDDATDAWFIGFDPDITVGVWVGYDQKRSLGTLAQGANTALPMWMDIMKTWVDRQRQALPRPPIFDRPGNVTFVMTEKGLEPFIAGTVKGKEK